MRNDYLIIHKSILPEFYVLVINARDLIENEGCSVSHACQEMGISRSTYYKYKDFIFNSTSEFGRKAIFAFKTYDKKGVLSSILNVVNETECSVIAINQGIPIKDSAYITLTLDLTEFAEPIDEMLVKFKKIKFVKSVNILAIG